MVFPHVDVPKPDIVELDVNLYDPTSGKPWCSFRAGSLVCTNGDRCLNKNHRKT